MKDKPTYVTVDGQEVDFNDIEIVFTTRSEMKKYENVGWIESGDYKEIIDMMPNAVVMVRKKSNEEE